MTTSYSVLIIEDEPLIVENYERALNHVETISSSISFKIDRAKDCQVAYDKITQAIITESPYDLVFLDIRLPSSLGHKIKSGEDLGMMIRKETPSTKIIVLTGYFEPSRLHTIMNRLRPDSFVVKNDIVFKDLITIIEKVIDHKNFFSNRILTLMKQQALNNGVLNELDIKLLLEISNGAKKKELVQLLPLGDSAINKHRSNIKEIFGNKTMSDRDMILIAKERGFI